MTAGRVLAVLLLLAGVVLALGLAGLLAPVAPDRAAMAPALPACEGWMVAEGITYLVRGPRRGEVVAVRADEGADGSLTPDAEGRDRILPLRVIGLPGDQVAGRAGSVFVNGVKADGVRTRPFPRVDLPAERYFLLGDNRSAARDSRGFGPVPRDAIAGRVLLVVWPLRELGLPGGRRDGAPLGPRRC